MKQNNNRLPPITSAAMSLCMMEVVGVTEELKSRGLSAGRLMNALKALADEILVMELVRA